MQKVVSSLQAQIWVGRECRHEGHACINTDPPTPPHTHVPRDMSACTHAHTHTCTAHTHTPTNTHTHTCTHRNTHVYLIGPVSGQVGWTRAAAGPSVQPAPVPPRPPALGLPLGRPGWRSRWVCMGWRVAGAGPGGGGRWTRRGAVPGRSKREERGGQAQGASGGEQAASVSSHRGCSARARVGVQQGQG